jgi:DNA replication protein DnaC
VLDDWGLAPLTDIQRRDVLEIVDDRHGARSTVIASQLPVGKWHDHLGDPTIADAVLDRVVHNAHRINLKGPTRRKNDDKT